ncbi:hypothetical protein [Streptomyces noursei]|uniref:hypothetical protein n=1 Tax=Streptomyces noursei TaxID=1971 RepID=UPI0021A2C67D|nr:hypothetical protein [Streptomyces noursei]UWS69863.1 hypothetical protein N1H47_00355 [Streptomyces noursei]UWS76918.1 hypothetical protein N1H47_40180 [Streptomyces noursei]
MSLMAEVGVNKPANSDVYTTHLADFVETFFRILGDPELPHLFFVEGGAGRGERPQMRLRLEEQAQ